METRRRDAKRAGTVVSDDCPVVSLPEVYYFIRRARRGRASVSSGWLHSCARRGPQRASRAAEVRAATCSTPRRCRATCASRRASARDAAGARPRAHEGGGKISAAMWARVVVLSVVVLGFVGGVFYASSKMRFVEDILPKISGASARPVAPPRPPPRAPRPRASAPPVERFVLPAAPSNRPILTRVPLVHPRHPQTPVRSGRSTSRSRASR